MSVSLQYSYGETVSDMTVFGGRAFERQLSHEDEALMTGISAFRKEAPESLLSCFCHVRTRGKGGCL